MAVNSVYAIRICLSRAMNFAAGAGLDSHVFLSRRVWHYQRFEHKSFSNFLSYNTDHEAAFFRSCSYR